MNIQVRLLGRDGQPLGKGLRLALLEQGQPIAEAETDDHGVVSFPVDAEGKEGLAVRLAGLPEGPGRD